MDVELLNWEDTGQFAGSTVWGVGWLLAGCRVLGLGRSASTSRSYTPENPREAFCYDNVVLILDLSMSGTSC